MIMTQPMAFDAFRIAATTHGRTAAGCDDREMFCNRSSDKFNHRLNRRCSDCSHRDPLAVVRKHAIMRCQSIECAHTRAQDGAE